MGFHFLVEGIEKFMQNSKGLPLACSRLTYRANSAARNPCLHLFQIQHHLVLQDGLPASPYGPSYGPYRFHNGITGVSTTFISLSSFCSLVFPIYSRITGNIHRGTMFPVYTDCCFCQSAALASEVPLRQIASMRVAMFSLPISLSNPFSITDRGCSFTWERIMVIRALRHLAFSFLRFKLFRWLHPWRGTLHNAQNQRLLV